MNTRIETAAAAGGAASLLFVTDPATINRLQHLAVDKSRLRIPLLFGFDVFHGLHTIFPVPLGDGGVMGSASRSNETAWGRLLSWAPFGTRDRRLGARCETRVAAQRARPEIGR
jgi:hypothetical protein